jgi:D-beta-D-heptose 7-phosphate kinase/D-beta-D-heptose 1-phosphate adenosyltransferase
MTIDTTGKIRSRHDAAAWREAQRGIVVFTNGVFDLVHPGHVTLLEAARSEGDGLIVGVNSDASARRLNKGPGRPFVPALARARVIAAFGRWTAWSSSAKTPPIELIQASNPMCW